MSNNDSLFHANSVKRMNTSDLWSSAQCHVSNNWYVELGSKKISGEYVYWSLFFFLQKIVKNVFLEYIRVLKSVYTKTFSKAEIKGPSLTSSRKIANPPNSYVVLYWPVSLILDNFWSLWLCGVSRNCGLWPKEKTPREYVNWSFWFLQILVNCS